MENSKYVEFRKKRDVGQILSDSIKFLGAEWQPLFSVILKVSIIPIFIAVVAGVFYTSAISETMERINQSVYSNIDPFEELLTFNNLGLPIILFLLAYILVYACITIGTFSYIKSYANNRGIVNFQKVNELIKEKFWPFIGMSIVNGIIIAVGMLFCILPGIYFAYVLVLSSGILIFHNMGAMDSISESFSMIKGHWWNTFGVLLLVALILGVIAFIINLPMTLYSAGTSLELDNLDQSKDVFPFLSDPVYLILLVLSYIVDFILYGVRMISTAFVFFDIEEQENPTTPDIIDTIGSSN